MRQFVIRPNWIRFVIIGMVGLALFLYSASSYFGGEEPVISKQKAERLARTFAEHTFDEQPLKATTVYQTEAKFYGYLNKAQLLDSFDKIAGDFVPYDMYQVNLTMPDKHYLVVYLHMVTGRVVAWDYTDYDAQQIGISEDQRTQLAKKYILKKGFSAKHLKQYEMTADDHIFFEATDKMVGEASLMIEISPMLKPNGTIIIATYNPYYLAPDSYTDYVDRQDKIADTVGTIDMTLMMFAFFVGAVIYAIVYRQYGSFKRGIALAIIFTVIYLANTWNMKDAFIASMEQNERANFLAMIELIVQSFYLVGIALLTYASLVAGDALWRAQGRPIWARFRERGYGIHVWDSMKLGYLIAFILLGVQVVIFVILYNFFGVWDTTDVTESPYNMAYPLLMPLLAWCAAISEEAIYRLFGIAIFKKWFKNTFIACLIPTVLWAAGHITYATYPSSTRIIELTIIGLLFSFFFLRYGLITVIFAHAIFDSILMSIQLFTLGGAANVAFGIFYIILPVIVAAVIRYFAHKKSEPLDESLTRPLTLE